MKIKLGQVVRDKVTGFTGTAIGRTEWLNGCIRIGVQPKTDKDGKMVEAQWLDEPQLEVVKEHISKEERNTKTGGPIPAPRRQENPK